MGSFRFPLPGTTVKRSDAFAESRTVEGTTKRGSREEMTDTDDERPLFFSDRIAFRQWLDAHHDATDVQWVGFYKKATGRASITWPESVDEALCYGWIDGLRKSIDDQAYKIRFTPRREGSHWSHKNLERMAELIDEGRVRPPGLRAFEARDPEKTRRASYEQEDVSLPEGYLARIRENEAAWAWFESSRPSYRKQVSWWIVSAKRQATRERRLEILIRSSEEGKVIPPLRWTVEDKS